MCGMNDKTMEKLNDYVGNEGKLVLGNKEDTKVYS